MKKLFCLMSVVALMLLSACDSATHVTPSTDQVQFLIDGGEQIVDISTDGRWSVKDCPDWVKTDAQDNKLIIKTGRNDSGALRKGDIVLTGKNVTAIIHVMQAAKCTHITPSSDKVEFGKEGGTLTVNIDTDGIPQVQASDGFTASYANGVLTVTAAPNVGAGAGRRGEIKLTCEDQSITIYASQKSSVCKRCGGSGKITCPKCHGKGWYPIEAAGGGAACERCGGRWNGFTDDSSDWKDGTGRISCPDCGGTGVGS